MFIATTKEKKGNKVRVYKRWGPQFGRFFLFFFKFNLQNCKIYKVYNVMI